jgi:hypothetical protein
MLRLATVCHSCNVRGIQSVASVLWLQHRCREARVAVEPKWSCADFWNLKKLAQTSRNFTSEVRRAVCEDRNRWSEDSDNTTKECLVVKYWDTTASPEVWQHTHSLVLLKVTDPCSPHLVFQMWYCMRNICDLHCHFDVQDGMLISLTRQVFSYIISSVSAHVGLTYAGF